MERFGLDIKLNSEKDNAKILTLMDKSEIKRFLGKVHPKLSEEWDIEKITDLLPFNSGQLVTKRYSGDANTITLG